MATAAHNLDEFLKDVELPSAEEMTFGIAVAQWNREVTQALLEGAINTLLEKGAKRENITVEWVPGTFELPLGAQFLFKYNSVDAVICIGVVVRGDTPHFDYVCEGATQGILGMNMRANKPVIFGVLTTDTQQQALDRAGGKLGNKGDDAAVAAIWMTHMQRRMSKGDSKKIGFGG